MLFNRAQAAETAVQACSDRSHCQGDSGNRRTQVHRAVLLVWQSRGHRHVGTCLGCFRKKSQEGGDVPASGQRSVGSGERVEKEDLLFVVYSFVLGACM